MAALPSPTQVAGNHSAIYEAYYSQVDPNGVGTIGAMEAARFLKRSGLSDVVLSRVWDLSDPGGRGSLDKSGFYVALKLVALAQAGKDINMSNIHMDMPPPKMGDKLPVINRPPKPPPPTSNTPSPSPTPLITSLPPSITTDWSIKPTEREKYDRLFESLQPLNGMIPGNKVKGVLMESKLPLDTLGKIWDLADMDKDGMLDRHEFVVAMHLVYKALEKYTIPNTLPPELIAPEKKKLASPVGGVPVLPRGMDGIKPEVPPPQPKPVISWVVTMEEKSKYDIMFTQADIDRDGYVSGLEIKDVFLKSGVPQPVLAHIWGLCDLKQSGKLNSEQFALAMWLVERCLKGQEPPVSLAPEMVPPSFRNNKSGDGHVENNNTPYTNPELDMISKDIEELGKEKLTLQNDIAQKEADIRVKKGEIQNLQSELDTLAATRKQLENQKGEAQKRLNDLKAQSTSVVSELEEYTDLIKEEQEKVDKLRSQAEEQAEVLKVQESELTSKKEQLENLRKEEERLEKQKTDSDSQLNRLTTNLQDTQLQISQAKAKITQLQEQQRQMNDAITACDAAIQTGDGATVADTALRINPDFRDAEFDISNDSPKQNGFSNDHDPFNDHNGQMNNNGFTDDPFKSDPFKNNGDTFSSNDPFAAAFSNPVSDNFSSDPFNEFGNTENKSKSDPFDPFGDGKRNPDKTPAEDEKDPFGCDPFAILHAPTRDGAPPGRPTSPSPALPPKKSKQPPPRPAPPRPMQPPRPAQPNMQDKDPFSSNTSDPFASSGGFANFADFDSKFSNKTTSTTSGQQKQKMEFTDDPFRDYRYEDPFNIADPFDDEPSDVSKNSTDNLDAFGFSAFSTNSKKDLKTKSVDMLAFGLGGRQSVPLPTSNTLSAAPSFSGRSSAPIMDPFTKTALSEDQQLAWAAEESLRLEEQRKKRQLQEQADLDYAIALSRADKK